MHVHKAHKAEMILKNKCVFSTGAAEKPYTVEDAVSYNELDYLSVSVIIIIIIIY